MSNQGASVPPQSIVRTLRSVSILETISFLALLVMMFSDNDSGVSIAGAIHGFLFLGYAFLVARDREAFGWTWGFVALAVLTGPLGAIIVLEKLRHIKS